MPHKVSRGRQIDHRALRSGRRPFHGAGPRAGEPRGRAAGRTVSACSGPCSRSMGPSRPSCRPGPWSRSGCNPWASVRRCCRWRPCRLQRPGSTRPAGTPVLERAVLLVGGHSQTLFAWAESRICIERLPAALRNGLLSGGLSIGQLLLLPGFESRREGLWYGRERPAILPAGGGGADGPGLPDAHLPGQRGLAAAHADHRALSLGNAGVGAACRSGFTGATASVAAEAAPDRRSSGT